MSALIGTLTQRSVHPTAPVFRYLAVKVQLILKCWYPKTQLEINSIDEFPSYKSYESRKLAHVT